MEFCGQDNCRLDANGRLKLSNAFLDDFRRLGDQVVMHCLPEGALGIYPPPIWSEMRRREPGAPTAIAASMRRRREARRFGAWTSQEKITNQGRLTIPANFRQKLGLAPGEDVIVVGCEIGVEVWNPQVWERETALLDEQELRRADAEFEAEIGPDRAPMPA